MMHVKLSVKRSVYTKRVNAHSSQNDKIIDFKKAQHFVGLFLLKNHVVSKLQLSKHIAKKTVLGYNLAANLELR